MKVVLDTNVLLSAFATRGLCETVLAACLSSHEIVLSDFILEELERHLVETFDLGLGMARERVKFLRGEAQIVVPARLPDDVCRDSKDVAVLGTAVAGAAEVLVTGDKDLQSIGVFRGIPILSPRAFYEKIR